MSVGASQTLSWAIEPFTMSVGGSQTLSWTIGVSDDIIVLELEGAPTGLVGQMTVAIYTLFDAVVYGPTTTGIVESPPDTGRYLATVTKPAVGRYLVRWSDGVNTTTANLTVIDDNWLRPPLRAVSDGNYGIKAGDLEPPIIVTLSNSDGEPIDLTPVAVLTGHIRTPDGTVLDRAAGILDAEAGRVMFAWESGETDMVGRYYDDWKMTLDDGRTITVPSNGGFIVSISNDWGLGSRWPGNP